MAERQYSETREEWVARYKEARWCDLQSFKANWRSVLCESFLALVANAFFGFAVGALLSLAALNLGMVPVLEILQKACAK